MRYALVSTPKYLLCVDLMNKKTAPIEMARAEYYGISWFPNSDQLVLSHSNLENDSLVDIDSYALSEVGYISLGSQKSRPFLSQPHQILCAPDGRIVCTNTGRNVISIIDMQKPGVYQEAGVSPARWDRLSLDDKIGDHINSVFLKNNQLFVVCHRFKKGAALATYDYQSLELVDLKTLPDLTGIHNIWVNDEGQYISCNSEAGTLVDLASGELLWESGTAIFTRGIAATQEYVLVGESQVTARSRRDMAFSGLWILERHTWKVMDYICLGPFGGVHEVRLLDVPDEAHHGHPFQNVTSLLQCNMYEEVTKRALQTASAAVTGREYWHDYNLILGTPELLPDGSKKASSDNLCLTLRNQKNDLTKNSFAFDFVLEASTPISYVSAVMGYHGSFDDTNMYVLLLQRNGDTASLSLWQHNGEWRPFQDIAVHNLPTIGLMQLNSSKNEISVLIQKREVLRLNPARMALGNYNSGFGIRWMGSSVRPRN